MSSHLERQLILSDLIRRHQNLDRLPERDLRTLLADELSRRNQHGLQSYAEQQVLLDSLIDCMRGFDILQPLMEDPSVTEILVNGPQAIFAEREGRLKAVPLRFDNEEHLQQLIARVFGRANQLLNEQHPIASLRLPDGSRLHAVLPPAAPGGPALAIRRFTGIKPSLEQLCQKGSLSPEAAAYLQHAVQQRKNLFVSGGTGTGKTTFLNALSAAIPRQERVITIEDTAELELQGLPNCLRLEARSDGPQGGGISLRELIRSSLRLRPDRIIVGEVRGAEAFDMIQAMSTGHPGSMSTGHGNSPVEMLDRLCLMLLLASNLPWEALRRLIAASLNLMVQLERLPNGKRQVKLICEILELQGSSFRLRPIFQREQGKLVDRRQSLKQVSCRRAIRPRPAVIRSIHHV